MTGILRPKTANHFRVLFDNFGNGSPDLSSQVIRVTRPGVAFISVFGTPEVSKDNITLILRDDALDLTRSEVITQVIRQTATGDTFTMIIETIDNYLETVERWHLADCRILECQLDELDCNRTDGLTIRLVVGPGVITVSLNGGMAEFLPSQESVFD